MSKQAVKQSAKKEAKAARPAPKPKPEAEPRPELKPDGELQPAPALEKALEKAPAPGEATPLETYPVNEPYAYVDIETGKEQTYRVREAELTRGEAELIKEIKVWLYEMIDIDIATLEDPEEFLKAKVKEVVHDFGVRLTAGSLEKINYYIIRDMVGYGRLDAILRDKNAEDISADGPDVPVYIYHQKYGSLRTNIVFDREELDSLIYRLAQRSGRHISASRPLLDASLPNQDRLQLSIGSQVTTKGSTFTIRKFRETPFTPIDLINLGTLSVEMAAYFWLAIENGFNVILAGGTASGKTSFLNSISMFIPPASKVVSIEDTREINLMHENWIPAVTRETEGSGAIEMYDLLKAALRQRPEYLLVGEVRGREAYTLFQAMSTGHITFSTFHADSVDSLVKRLTKPPIDIPLMLLDSIDIVALLGMVKTGNVRGRRCTNVFEVNGVDFESQNIKRTEIFRLGEGGRDFLFGGESSVFLKIMEKLNIGEEELAVEFTRRVRLLKWLSQSKEHDFYAMSQLLFDYAANPQEVEARLLVGEAMENG